MYSSVLLPDPEGPMMAAESPRLSARLTPERIARGPRGVAYSLLILETSSMDAFGDDPGVHIERARRHAGHAIMLAHPLGPAPAKLFGERAVLPQGEDSLGQRGRAIRLDQQPAA